MTSTVDQAAFRGALGRFASGVTVVTTLLDGIDHAMTASAFTSVSLDPALVLVCSHKTSRFHEAVLETGTWGVSILAEEGELASAWFANRGRQLENQLADFAVTAVRDDIDDPLLYYRSHYGTINRLEDSEKSILKVDE